MPRMPLGLSGWRASLIRGAASRRRLTLQGSSALGGARAAVVEFEHLLHYIEY